MAIGMVVAACSFERERETVSKVTYKMHSEKWEMKEREGERERGREREKRETKRVKSTS